MSAISTLSLAQALSIWSDLDDALHGVNGFGGDTAEIYIYRAQPCSPGTMRDAESIGTANAALAELFDMFERGRDCTITIDGRRVGPWLASAGFTHRLHARVHHNPTRLGGD